MAAAVQVFKNSMIEADRLKAEQEAAQRVAAARSAMVDELTRDFDSSVRAWCRPSPARPRRWNPPPSR